MKPIIRIQYTLLSGSWETGYYIMYMKMDHAPLHGMGRDIRRIIRRIIRRTIIQQQQ